jgi:lysophospholipase L1-like esterase
MAVAVLLALTPLTAGCHDRGEPDLRRYVALGDSYTSGAGLAQLDPGSGSCERSRLSYPALVAKALDADLTDASCGGAATVDANHPQVRKDGSLNPPQLDGLTRSTDLVTVGLGFNNQGWFGGLVGCAFLAHRDPAVHPCQDAKAEDYRPSAAQQIGDAVRETLDAVHDRSPDARVLLVGYPQLVPAEVTCPELPLAVGDYPFVRSSLELLDTELRRAAEEADATYVDVMAASAGHDICAGREAWVNGAHARPGVAAPYHPFAVEQREVADLVLTDLGRRASG